MGDRVFPLWRTPPITKEPEPTPDMGGFEAQFTTENMLRAPDAVMHLFYGLVQAISQLGAGTVRADLEHRTPWLTTFYDSPADFWKEVGADEKWFDTWLAAFNLFNHDAGRALARWLWQRTMPAVELWVYMPCHTQWGRLTFNTDTLTASMQVG
jgi:hypothetical protein